MENNSKKKSTIFPHAWFKSLEKVPDDIAGRIYKAVQRLDITGEMTNFESGTIEDILFSQFAFQTDEFGNNYAQVCENRSKAAKEREAKKHNEHKAAQANSFVEERIGEDRIGMDRIGEDAAAGSQTKKATKTRNKFKNFDERNYSDSDYAEIERKMMGGN